MSPPPGASAGASAHRLTRDVGRTCSVGPTGRPLDRWVTMDG